MLNHADHGELRHLFVRPSVCLFYVSLLQQVRHVFLVTPMRGHLRRHLLLSIQKEERKKTKAADDISERIRSPAGHYLQARLAFSAVKKYPTRTLAPLCNGYFLTWQG